jgi:glycosyltransferase involved in cell wall biosynthesis
MQQSHLRILMIAYACSPTRGGEHLLGWNWACRLAEAGHEVTVLTARHRLIESVGHGPPGLQLIGVNDRAFRFLHRLGLLGEQIYYQLWIRTASKAVKRLTSESPIDVVHQCTFHTFRMACHSALWVNKPVIWGPVAGLERVPRTLLPVLGWGIWSEMFRALANALYLHRPRIRRCLAAADHVVVSNKDTLGELEKAVPRRYEYIPANAVELPRMGDYKPPLPGQLDVLAVGAIVPMRPYSLVLKAIASMPQDRRAGLSLTFIGEGRSQRNLKRLARSLSLENTVCFLGTQPRAKTLERMRAAHLLVFPSLRDSGSSSVAEAMSMGLPVLALDLAGPGEMLAKGGGFLLTSRTAGKLVVEIKQWLERLLQNPEMLQAASIEARNAAGDLFDWPKRIRRMEELYRSAIQLPQRKLNTVIDVSGRCSKQSACGEGR